MWRRSSQAHPVARHSHGAPDRLCTQPALSPNRRLPAIVFYRSRVEAHRGPTTQSRPNYPGSPAALPIRRARGGPEGGAITPVATSLGAAWEDRLHILLLRLPHSPCAARPACAQSTRPRRQGHRAKVLRHELEVLAARFRAAALSPTPTTSTLSAAPSRSCNASARNLRRQSSGAACTSVGLAACRAVLARQHGRIPLT
jgi:hypothetical protein